MKMITKTFYVSNGTFKEITKQESFMAYTMQFHDSCDAEMGTVNPIQISWQDPEKKIEITESEFDAIMDSVEADRSSLKFREVIKQKLFGTEE